MISHPVAGLTPSLAVGDVDLVLGSASPRRQALLATLERRFVVRAADVDERIDETQNAADNARRLARAKFDALAFACADDVELSEVDVLTADTLVSCDGRVLSKPRDRDDAQRMLGLVSGRPIEVTTAMCFGAVGALREVEVRTRVELRELLRIEMTAYLDAGSADDKAGGLSLQDAARPFVSAVHGCWSNVIGLPLCAVTALLVSSSDARPFELRRSSLCTEGLCGGTERGGDTT